MGRKKIIGICKVEGCERELDSLGLCGLHYRRQYYKGRLHSLHDGRRGHPQYYNWASRKDKICEEWKDFWKFVRDVGEKPPSKMHYLRKINKDEPFGPTNFKWVEHLKKLPEETMQQWHARKWKHRTKDNIKKPRSGGQKKNPNSRLSIRSMIRDHKTLEQENKCEICKNYETRINKKTNQPILLSIDHCHKTDKIRGLLCAKCNTVLGRMKDSIPYLQSMIDYLTKYSS